MKRKYLGVGLMAALVFSAVPLSGTAGGLEDGQDEAPVFNRCATVADSGKAQMRVKPPTTTVQLASSDKLVVCLTIWAKAGAIIDADLNAKVEGKAGEEIVCPDSDGDGYDERGQGLKVELSPALLVAPDHSAKATLTATVHADANVSLNGGEATGETRTFSRTRTYSAPPGPGPVVVDSGDPENPAVEYCKAVKL